MGNFPYHIFCDSFFTTVPLLEELHKRNINATGTMKEIGCRNVPFCQKKKSRGTFDYKSTENKFVVVQWNDNNLVNVAFLPVYAVDKVSRYSRKEKKRVLVEQPHLIHKYNSFMGGVDRCDQNISLYKVAIGRKKWYFPIIAYCLDIAEQNAWQLHRCLGGKLDHLNSRRKIAETLLESHQSSGKKRGRPHSMEHCESQFDNKDNYIVSKKSRHAAECHKKIQRKSAKCDVALHVECLLLYHINLN